MAGSSLDSLQVSHSLCLSFPLAPVLFSCMTFIIWFHCVHIYLLIHPARMLGSLRTGPLHVFFTMAESTNAPTNRLVSDTAWYLVMNEFQFDREVNWGTGRSLPRVSWVLTDRAETQAPVSWIPAQHPSHCTTCVNGLTVWAAFHLELNKLGG